MQFRPCIDIHNGKVKQIVGGSLTDKNNAATENFVSEKGADYYAELYRSHGLKGGHIILLNAAGSEYYDADCEQAFSALSAFPNGLQIGGGINAENAERFLKAGASHVIVTSYVFKDGKINYENLRKIKAAAGKEHLCLDLSCRKRDSEYFIVTDRWQKFTDSKLTSEILTELSSYCDEFLVHAVDSEGFAKGIEQEVAKLLGGCNNIPVTYAGGISSLDDIALLDRLGNSHVNFTVGTALDLFGGKIPFEECAKYNK